MSRRRSLLLLCAAAALLSAALQLWLFRDGSLNNDEVAYLQQAEALAHGHLFLHVPAPVAAHRPWFFTPEPSGLVSKYLPFVSAVQAVGLRLTGSVVPVLALLAALVPLTVDALAREVGLPDRDALVAAALVSASPLVLMESAVPLSYVLFLVLVTTGWLLGLRIGLGRAGAGAAVLLGLAVTACAGVRPYDTVLLLGPVLLWAAWQRRLDLLRLLPALVVGAAPLAAAVLAYNDRATGSALHMPFGLLDPHDALGFGLRRILPEDSLRGFSLLQGLHGLALHFGLDPLRWYALGLLLVPAAAVAWRRSTVAVRVLLVAAAAQLVGYAFFWGPWNFSVLWGRGTRVLGPIYAVSLTVPVMIAGLPVLKGWLQRPRRARWLAVVAVAVSAVQLGSALVQASFDAGRTRTVLAAAERGRVDGVVRYDTDPPYLGHPVSGLTGGTLLAAWAPVPAAGAPVPDLLQLPKAVYGNRVLTYALTAQERVAGATVPLQVSLVGTTADVLVVERAGRATACALTPRVDLVLTPTGATGCSSAPVPAAWTSTTSRHCPDTSCLVLVVYRRGAHAVSRRGTWRQLQVETGPDGVALVVDGAPVESRGNGWLRVAAG